MRTPLAVEIKCQAIPLQVLRTDQVENDIYPVFAALPHGEEIQRGPPFPPVLSFLHKPKKRMGHSFRHAHNPIYIPRKGFLDLRSGGFHLRYLESVAHSDGHISFTGYFSDGRQDGTFTVWQCQPK